jgi:hypothetical protein
MKKKDFYIDWFVACDSMFAGMPEKYRQFRALFQTKKLLQEITGKGILFGHQDDLAYGIGWNSISGESDVKRITNSYPAVFGWDFGNIGDAENLDGVPFDSIRAYIIKAYEMGGIIP